MRAIVLVGMTGAGKTFVVNNNFLNSEYQIITFNKHWNNAKDYLKTCMNRKNSLVIDNKGLNVEQLYKCIRDLKDAGYNVKLLYIKSNLESIRKRTDDKIIYDEYETLPYSLEILSSVADSVQTITNI